MNTITTFTNDTLGTVRTMSINGNPHFIGKDVAEVLGYTNTPKAIRDHVDDEDKLTERIVLSGQNREVIFINESGLYSLILSSKLPSAKQFKRWVTTEVLPAIRKNGGYIDGMENLPDEEKAKLEAEIVELRGLVRSYESKFKRQNEQMDALAKLIENDACCIRPSVNQRHSWDAAELYDLDVEGYDEFQSDMELFNFSDYSLKNELQAIVNSARDGYIDGAAANYLIGEVNRLFIERNAR